MPLCPRNHEIPFLCWSFWSLFHDFPVFPFPLISILGSCLSSNTSFVCRSLFLVSLFASLSFPLSNAYFIWNLSVSRVCLALWINQSASFRRNKSKSSSPIQPLKPRRPHTLFQSEKVAPTLPSSRTSVRDLAS